MLQQTKVLVFVCLCSGFKTQYTCVATTLTRWECCCWCFISAAADCPVLQHIIHLFHIWCRCCEVEVCNLCLWDTTSQKTSLTQIELIYSCSTFSKRVAGVSGKWLMKGMQWSSRNKGTSDLFRRCHSCNDCSSNCPPTDDRHSQCSSPVSSH